jgi:hypothetical protein
MNMSRMAMVSMTFMLAIALTLGAIPGVSLGLSSVLAATTVEPDEGVDFAQVDFLFEEATVPDSNWGQVTADPQELADATGIDDGYLNVYTDVGWVVQNLAVTNGGSSPTVAYLTLGLDQPEDVILLSAYVDFSPVPQLDFGDGTRSDFPVGVAQWDAEGAGDSPTTDIGDPPPPDWMQFIEGGPVLAAKQENQNVQCARNQCFPMSIANSLQYLEEQHGLNVPHNHVPGLKGDNSLVGQLDTAANRTAPSRTSGSGVWFTPMLQGKFSYLDANGLKDKLVHKHQGRGYGTPPNQALPAGDFQSSGITSKDEGAVVTWDWICEQLAKGQDVELVFSYDDANGNPTGGHAVRVFACGTTLGVPWIGYLHDSSQTNSDPTDTQGLEAVLAYAVDTDGDGTLNFGAPNREIRFALSESVVPEPTKVPASPSIYIFAAAFGACALAYWLIRRRGPLAGAPVHGPMRHE